MLYYVYIYIIYIIEIFVDFLQIFSLGKKHCDLVC